MNFGRILVVFSLTLMLAGAAEAKYQRTIDGKTKVWQNGGNTRYQASWSGGRDERGYATGTGTLTWFTTRHDWGTGSLLPGTKYIQVNQYKGRMVEGKLDGSVVVVDSKGKTFHARFQDGVKSSEWIAGSVPASRKPANENVTRPKQVEAPAEAPPPTPKIQPPRVAEKPAPPQPLSPAPKDAVAKQPAESASPSSDSLRSLTMPPSSLRVASIPEPSPQPSAPPVDKQEPPAAAPSEEPVVEPASTPRSVKDEDAETVAALDSEYHTALKTNDANTIDRILADDFVLMPGSGQTLNKADIVKQARDKQAKYEHHDVENGTQKVRVWRDTAVVTETVWVKGAEAGKPVDQKMSVTETFVRTPDGWRYVSGQAAPPTK